MTQKEDRTMKYIAKTDDGRYGLTPAGELWKIAGRNSYMAGYVGDPGNIEYAADEADEEMRVLTAQALAEFKGSM
tara:strand:+ start:146 stop:370 length:225 start_codon:yes stop_codon:yes gene_type:complete